MNLEQELARTLDKMAMLKQQSHFSAQDIISLIDLTLLDAKASSEDIKALANKASQHHVAAICVLPEHLNDIDSKIKIKRATVANFPTGQECHETVLRTVEELILKQQIDEIDYVFPYKDFLVGNQQPALSSCRAISELCKQHHLIFKVILETGALPSLDSIYELSIKVLEQGCDFLKTSTGKIATGATIPAVFAMLAAIIDHKAACGIKASGNIKTREQALSYMHLAEYMLNRKPESSWFRLGASSLIDNIIANKTP